MASQQRTKSSRRSGRNRSSNSGRGRSNGRSASQKDEKYRFAQNLGNQRTVPEREYERYALSDPTETGEDPDVLLDVPVVKVDSIHLDLQDLEARVALKAKVLDLVKLDVGIEAHLGRVCVDIKGVEAQALLKVRLDHVAAIVDRVLTTIDRNPELVKSLGRAVEDVGSGARQTLGGAGEAVEDVGAGAGGAVQDVGQGAGQAAGDLGQGASDALGQVGQGAGQAVGQVGQGAGQATGQLGQGAGQAVGDLGQGAGQTAGQAVGGAGQAVGQLGQAAGGLTGGLAGQQQQGGQQQPQGGGQQGAGGAQQPNATQAALEAAQELGVDLGQIKGSGAKGRITVRDVRKAG